MNRKGFIGGSDIASVMGKSRWKTPLHLWAEKTGIVEPDDLSNVEAVQLGSELEDFVAKKFEKASGLKVRRAPQYYTNKDHPFMRCQVDRLIQGKDELLECKTCSAWKVKEWEGEDIPTEYILQVMWQLGITGRKIGWIAVLIGGQKFLHKRIDFDKEMYNNMVTSAVDFWDCVTNRIEPQAVGLDNSFIAEIKPESDDQVQAIEEMNDRIAMLQQLKNTIKETIDQKNEIEAGIKQVIGDNLGISTSEYVVTWKTQRTARVDIQALKDAKVYDHYLTPSQSRVLRVRNVRKEGE